MTGDYEGQKVEDLIDAFETEVRRRRPELAAPLDAAGYRRVTAAALLFRGLELLDATRACPGAVRAPARELLLRSAIEVALRGRFLLGPKGADELRRMTEDYLDSEPKKAKAVGAKFGGLPPEFIAAVLPGKEVPEPPPPDLDCCGDPPWEPKPKPRNLFSIAQSLDAGAKLSADDKRSAVYAYRLLYGWLSGSAAHAGFAALRRFTETRDGKAGVVETPDPLTTGRRLHVIVAGHLGDLARLVFVAFNVPTGVLDETGVGWSSRPPPGSAPGQGTD